MILYSPYFSVIVPVLNEEETIEAFLLHVNHIAGSERIEIIIVDADPAGGTVCKIRDERVVKLLSPTGRGIQMNRGAEAAKGDILLFLHADTRLPRNAFTRIKDALRNIEYAGGAFDLGIDSDRAILRLTARCASLKHRITRVPYGDQVIFLRRDFFRAIGGYAEIPLFEDVELMRRIKKLGGKIIILKLRAVTSPRKWEKEGAVYTIIRNWMIQILYLIGISPEFLVKMYYGNKK